MPKIKNGDIIKCTVTGITDYGIFIKSENDYTGLCHISEISNYYVKDIILPQTYNISSHIPVLYILERVTRELQNSKKRSLPLKFTSRNL